MTASRIAQPKVSVVIPTHRRPDQVVDAVRSALNQTYPPDEVVIVVDGGDPETLDALENLQDPRLEVASLIPAGGAGAARNEGVRHASGDLIAFLDDDDRWLPRKLEAQVSLHWQAADPLNTVSATRARWVHEAGEHVWPLRSPRRGESIAEYLFIRRRAGEGVLATPTLMAPRELALSVPMPTDLPTHEEWDWLLTLQGRGIDLLLAFEVLAVIRSDAGRESLSSSGQDWKASLGWARGRRQDLGPRAFSAFVLTEVGRAATLGREGLATHLRILLASLEGKPRIHDMLRHLLRPVAYGRRRRGA